MKTLLRLNHDAAFSCRHIANVFGKMGANPNPRTQYTIRKMADLPEKVLVNGKPYEVCNSHDDKTILTEDI